MGLKKLTEKVADYNARLDHGKASKIKPDHVRKVIEKLRRKEADLAADLAAAKHHDKRNRIERKIGVAREQISRAQWLLDEIG